MPTIRCQLAEGEIEETLGRVEGALGDEAVQNALVIEVLQILSQCSVYLENNPRIGCRYCLEALASQAGAGSNIVPKVSTDLAGVLVLMQVGLQCLGSFDAPCELCSSRFNSIQLTAHCLQ